MTDAQTGIETKRKRSPNETSKKNFTNNRLTNLQIFKLRVYFEKLIWRQSRCSGWSGGQGELSEWGERGEWVKTSGTGETGKWGERGENEFYDFRNFMKTWSQHNN